MSRLVCANFSFGFGFRARITVMGGNCRLNNVNEHSRSCPSLSEREKTTNDHLPYKSKDITYSMASICLNNLKAQVRANLLCKVSRLLRAITPCAVVSQVITITKAQDCLQAFGIRLVPSPSVVQIAKHNGYDALFIDLEHSTLSLNDSMQLCTAGLLAGITPFVRVPYRCGEGFVQRVLDGGAMGVIFPHIHEKGNTFPLPVSFSNLRVTPIPLSNLLSSGCRGRSTDLQVSTLGQSIHDWSTTAVLDRSDASAHNHRAK